jgi:hypothetical protein
MANTSYPNVVLTSTTLSPFIIDGRHDKAVITSTLGSSVNLQITAATPAGLQFWAVQYGAGEIGITAGSGASVHNVGGFSGTSGQYGTILVTLVTDGNAVFSGDAA